MTMLLDREYFNSGDKFILTMSNSERTNHFHRYGLKYLRDFNAIINPKQKFISSKQKINFIFEQLHLQTPNCFEVEDIEVKLEYTRIELLFNLTFEIYNLKISVSYKISYTPFNFDCNKTSDKLYQTESMPKIWDISSNEKLTIIIKIDTNISLWANLVNLSNYWLYAEKHYDSFVADYIDNKFNDYFVKWKIFGDECPKMFRINEMLNYYPELARFNVGYDRFFGIMSMVQKDYLELKYFLNIVKTDYTNNFINIDRILQNFYNQHIIK